MNTKSQITPGVKVLASRLTMLGVKATVALYLGDKEIYCDEVKLWQAKSREAFIKVCLKALGRNPSSKDTEKLRNRIDAWLRTEEKELL